jgi:hypothetical protein
MPGPVTREEFDELAEEVRGEKVVTRYILEQTRRNGDDLAALKTRVARVEDKVDGLDRKVDGLDRKVDGLVRDLPKVVGDVMREVLAEGRKKR